MNIRSGLTGLAVTAAALVALSTPVREALSTAAVAPTPAQSPAMPVNMQPVNESRAPAAAGGDAASLVIQEAHSDGGYSYWLSWHP
jgi:hypothetical protein